MPAPMARARLYAATALTAIGLTPAGPCAAQPLPYWNAQWGGPQGASLGLGLALGGSQGRRAPLEGAKANSAQAGGGQPEDAPAGDAQPDAAPAGGHTGRGLHIRSRSLLIEARPGIDGGALHVGVLAFSASTKGFQFAGVALKGCLLRTWGSPKSSLARDQTYAGAELHAAWVVKASIGALWRVSGRQGDSTVVTWSVGIGL